MGTNMKSVNGSGTTAAFEKYQGETKVSTFPRTQGPNGKAAVGNASVRGRVQPEEKMEQKKGAASKEPKADSLKEIMKMLKSLVETIAALISKLSGTSAPQTSAAMSATTDAASSPTTPETTSGATITAGGAAASSSPANSGGATNQATNVTNSPASEALSTSTTTSITPAPENGVTSIVTESEADDLAVREEADTLKTVTSTSTSTLEEGEGLQALKDETGAVSVLTDDGFTIRADVKDQAWSIIGPDGFATRIWGDPHVNESDGDKWDFLNQSTFVFGNNKVTTEVTPAGDGATYSARLSIYSGKDRVTISGIDTNKPTIDAVAHDGEQHDAQLSDGVLFTRGSNTRGESWSQKVDGKKDVMGH